MIEKPKLPDRILPIEGLELGVTAAGIRRPGRMDLAVIRLAPGSTTAAVFTRNAFCAAPVIVAREHLAHADPVILLINSGNANAGTGQSGLEDALACCEAAAAAAGCEKEQVLPFSTGVIGEPLPVEKITGALGAALGAADAGSWLDAARAIMTTDTVPKVVSGEYTVAGDTIRMTGMAKGAGMIRPDMATMLAYIATDARVGKGVLQSCLEAAVAGTFNRITVDGDTSTNDACVLIATGAGAGQAIEEAAGQAYEDLLAAVTDCCAGLAQAIVRDAEGATKFIRIEVEGGVREAECLAVAYAVAHSPLVKTAFFASDPNWGRILAAVGRAGIGDLDIGAVRIWINGTCIVRDGGRAQDYTEEQGQAAMAPQDITLRIELGRGEATATVWTSDLSFDYVKINAEYRT